MATSLFPDWRINCSWVLSQVSGLHDPLLVVFLSFEALVLLRQYRSTDNSSLICGHKEGIQICPLTCSPMVITEIECDIMTSFYTSITATRIPNEYSRDIIQYAPLFLIILQSSDKTSHIAANTGTPESSSGTQGLSKSAQLGVGLGLRLGGSIVLAALGAFAFWRRRHSKIETRTAAAVPAEIGFHDQAKSKLSAPHTPGVPLPRFP